VQLLRLTCKASLQQYSRTISMSSSATPLLIPPRRLASLMEESGEKLRILDATWFMPNVKRDAHQEWLAGPRLPKSTFWDVESVSSLKEEVDSQSGKSLNPLGLPHMMPSSLKFAKAAASQGISNDTLVVVYDTHGVFSSPRTAFTFFAFGHKKISILDGGLPGWTAEGLPTEKGESSFTPEPAEYEDMPLREGIIRSYDEMIINARMKTQGQTVLDARPNPRFTGKAPEPRPGLSSGHIPSSLSLPFSTLVDSHTHPTNPESIYTTLKSQTDLWRTISDSIGGLEKLDKLRQASSSGELAATNTCGSGMTAAVIWLALNQLGVQSAIYDEVSAQDVRLWCGMNSDNFVFVLTELDWICSSQRECH
jgi:thiosulfate/3-mercaptopyruvate sulfurtransferase